MKLITIQVEKPLVVLCSLQFCVHLPNVSKVVQTGQRHRCSNTINLSSLQKLLCWPHDKPAGGGVDVSVMLNLLSKLSVTGSELWDDVSDLLVTIRCSRSLSCFRFSISFCKQMAYIKVWMHAWRNYGPVKRYTRICHNIIQ